MDSEGLHRPTHPVRVVTATSLFDGHDAAINIMRRILQAQGAEVIHLGHDRSVDEVVRAAVEEDAQAVAISSYQGGHVEYFTFLVERLAAAGRADCLVFGGGGGVITESEAALLHSRGVTRLFSPHDGQSMGLAKMVNQIIESADQVPALVADLSDCDPHNAASVARLLTTIELGAASDDLLAALNAAPKCRVLGVTGTGGSGKSSLTDELVERLGRDWAGALPSDRLRIAVLAIDPTRRRQGGALLGDRIRMNTLAGSRGDSSVAGAPDGLVPGEPGATRFDADHLMFRSVATRGASTEVPECISTMVAACSWAGYDLVIVETPGIGQAAAAISELSDIALYVMTPEFGAPSQLEKIDMLDFADAVAINKFDRRGGEDALRDVRRQIARNREDFTTPVADLPVFGTIAARFNDDGVTALAAYLRDLLVERGMRAADHATASGDSSGGDATSNVVNSARLVTTDQREPSADAPIIPSSRIAYLAEVAASVRTYHAESTSMADAVRTRSAIERTIAFAGDHVDWGPTAEEERLSGVLDSDDELLVHLESLAQRAAAGVPPEADRLLAAYEAASEAFRGPDRATRTSLSGTGVPVIALPRTEDPAELVSFLRRENLPGHFPFTAGVFPTKRTDEDPIRMFAGEGGPAKTNRRFHLLAEGQPANRLSTAFDSVTLYGADPAARPDIYGKIGNSGVSIATVRDMADLYAGFDLCDPATSVSMTINGPAPAVLAMFLNTAVDQRIDRFVAEHGRQPNDPERGELAEWVYANVRGTVQADILKEDQGQNTCIFSTEFGLKMMADIAEWFVAHNVRRFYSVSISGYHIAEAGANPISQLAFTLANGFTYLEAYLARGLAIDDFAPNLSFFFSNGMDPEYTVLGRVARRIWAIALRDRYGASARSQRLKYHVQTSGRSLHAQEMAFNDIRTTLQALCAIYDRCNSLHTNAYDEAITTPTDESVRRAMAIQLIIGREWGLNSNDNPLQGSFIVDELTDLVEEAVLTELDAISRRGGVLGAMETGYQRGRIQDESMHYETMKHDGTLPIIGVNTFVDPSGAEAAEPELRRSDDAEKQEQLTRLAAFHGNHQDQASVELANLQSVALAGGNVFDALMTAVRHCSLGQISDALFEVGGRYRRNV